MLSVQTIQFLLDLVSRQQISAAAPNFDEIAAVVSQSKRELVELLDKAVADMDPSDDDVYLDVTMD